MTALLVAAGGIVLLLWFTVLIGISMDTEAQRRGRNHNRDPISLQ